jgi:hypothetical protein
MYLSGNFSGPNRYFASVEAVTFRRANNNPISPDLPVPGIFSKVQESLTNQYLHTG